MKIKTILTAACVVMLAFASCNQGGALQDDDKGETKSFFIQIEKPVKPSRAEGPDESAAEVAFADGILIFATGDHIGRVVRIVSGTPGDGEVTVTQLEAGIEIGEIPASTSHVYLYGNLGGAISGISTAAVVGGSMTDVAELTWLLSNIQNAANDVSQVPVRGEGTVAPGVSNPDRLESTVVVRPIASRLQIGSISCTDDRITELVLAGIYINGFYHSMDVDSTFQATYWIDNSIDKSKYPATGYVSYSGMSDILTPVDLKETSPVTPTADCWAYNFFPAEMPHIVLHFSSMKVDGEEDLTNQYTTVARYSTSPEGGEGNEFTTAKAGDVYKLNITISDYEQQTSYLPESGSSVMGYVVISIIDWRESTLYPEW